MNRNLFLSIVLIFLGSSAVGQSIKIEGRVLNIKEQPVPYANVGIISKGVGTSTNEAGQFQLIFDQSLSKDTLDISSIGYKTSALLLSKILSNKNDTLTIYLSEHHVVMKEVKVTALYQNAKYVVEEALSNYYKNYNKKRYQLQGFYRGLIRNDEQYVMLSEALVTIDDRGYKKHGDKRVRLDALRKSNDMRTMDSLDMHYDTLMESNDFLSLLRNDYIDKPRDSYSFAWWPSFSNQIIENYDFVLDSLSYYDDHLVYCISFFYRNQNNVKRTYEDINSLYIRTGDHALIEMSLGIKYKEVTSASVNNRGNKGYLVEGNFTRKTRVIYQPYKGYWYPRYISQHRSLIGGDRQKASRLAYDEARRLGTNELKFHDQSYNGRKIDPDKNNFFSFSELVITSVQDKKDKYRKVKLRDTLSSQVYIRNHKLEYDKQLWNKSSGLSRNPYIKQAKKHLAENLSLEVQFEANSNKE